MKKIEIFDPAMCCSTGVCGTSVDPELSRIASDLNKLKKQGIEIVRHNMGQEPLAFVENVEIGKLLQEQGPEVLPVTLVNTVIVKTKKYPTIAELEKWLGNESDADLNNADSLAESYVADKKPAFKVVESGCCGGSEKKSGKCC